MLCTYNKYLIGVFFSLAIVSIGICLTIFFGVTTALLLDFIDVGVVLLVLVLCNEMTKMMLDTIAISVIIDVVKFSAKNFPKLFAYLTIGFVDCFNTSNAKICIYY
jgi:hypothetical protein